MGVSNDNVNITSVIDPYISTRRLINLNQDATIEVVFAVEIIIEELGYANALEAYDNITSRYLSQVKSGEFVRHFSHEIGATFVINTAIISISAPIVNRAKYIIPSVAPTPVIISSSISTGGSWYTDLPFYAQIIIPCGVALVLLAICRVGCKRLIIANRKAKYELELKEVEGDDIEVSTSFDNIYNATDETDGQLVVSPMKSI
jgi:hypothetical protein